MRNYSIILSTYIEGKGCGNRDNGEKVTTRPKVKVSKQSMGYVTYIKVASLIKGSYKILNEFKVSKVMIHYIEYQRPIDFSQFYKKILLLHRPHIQAVNYKPQNPRFKSNYASKHLKPLICDPAVKVPSIPIK